MLHTSVQTTNKTFSESLLTLFTNLSGRSRFSHTGEGVHQPPRWGANLLFGQRFPKICMEMKEIGPRKHMYLATHRSANEPVLSGGDEKFSLGFSMVFLENIWKHT